MIIILSMILFCFSFASGLVCAASDMPLEAAMISLSLDDAVSGESDSENESPHTADFHSCEDTHERAADEMLIQHILDELVETPESRASSAKENERLNKLADALEAAAHDTLIGIEIEPLFFRSLAPPRLRILSEEESMMQQFVTTLFNKLIIALKEERAAVCDYQILLADQTVYLTAYRHLVNAQKDIREYGIGCVCRKEWCSLRYLLEKGPIVQRCFLCTDELGNTRNVLLDVAMKYECQDKCSEVLFKFPKLKPGANLDLLRDLYA
ncbi:hypothetical protein FJ365_04740 [Candidatus Dependentiae bacterium]|nr:hypothetical protein [Candidatus Dependentiae bacterium]